MDPGARETMTITGLYPHRSYCFGVVAIDDLGNRSPLATFIGERKLPLMHYPEVAVFNPSAQDDSTATVYASEPDTSMTYPVAANVGDVDGDGRDDFAVASVSLVASPAGRVTVTMSSAGTRTIAAPASGGWFGWSIAGGDFDADGVSDVAICAPALTTTAANGGALYLYYGQTVTGIRADTQSADPVLPSIKPDVALYAPGGAYFCDRAHVQEVNGVAGAELIVASAWYGNRTRVYGFYGGSRTRFPGGGGGATAVVSLDLDSTPGVGFTNRPEFSVRGKLTAAGKFPTTFVVADVDGNGVRDVVVSDSGAAHGDGTGTPSNGSGEVYVFSGGSALVGPVSAPDAVPTPLQLLKIVRYVPLVNGGFGTTMLSVPQPMGTADPADWVLIQLGSARQVLVFPGSATGAEGSIPASTYPLAPEDYVMLDRTDWKGLADTRFGSSMGVLGDVDKDGRIDVGIGPGTGEVVSHTVSIFSFDATNAQFVKRAILKAPQGFGYAIVGLDNHFGLTPGHTPQMLLGAYRNRTVHVMH
ncbi:MAG: integrin alpha [Myxococcota bacterium]